MTASRQRDSQKSAVYAAEQAVANMLDEAAKLDVTTMVIDGATIAVPIECKFGNLGALQRYVDLVLARTAEEYGVAPHITVRARKGNRQAHYDWAMQMIAIPPHQSWARSWAMRETVALHEIAHHLTRDMPPAHGPQFVAAEIDLFERFIGPEAGFMLRAFAHEGGVKIG